MGTGISVNISSNLFSFQHEQNTMKHDNNFFSHFSTKPEKWFGLNVFLIVIQQLEKS